LTPRQAAPAVKMACRSAWVSPKPCAEKAFSRHFCAFALAAELAAACRSSASPRPPGPGGWWRASSPPTQRHRPSCGGSSRWPRPRSGCPVPPRSELPSLSCPFPSRPVFCESLPTPGWAVLGQSRPTCQSRVTTALAPTTAPEASAVPPSRGRGRVSRRDPPAPARDDPGGHRQPSSPVRTRRDLYPRPRIAPGGYRPTSLLP
jgi:hypothetical protein